MKKTQGQPATIAHPTVVGTEGLTAVEGGFLDFDQVKVNVNAKKKMERKNSGNTRITDSNNTDLEEYWFLGPDFGGNLPVPSPADRTGSPNAEAEE